MNFNEWYEKWNKRTSKYSGEPEKKDVRSGWNACKKEVLKILKTGALGYNEIFCSDEAIEEIEKL